MKRLSALSAFLFGVLAPAWALACPVCAQNESGGIGRKIALGLFIFLPFAVVTTIILVVRGALRSEQKTFVERSHV